MYKYNLLKINNKNITKHESMKFIQRIQTLRY